MNNTSSIINAFKRFEHTNISNKNLHHDEILFKRGLEFISNHNFADAEKIFFEIYYHTANDTLKRESAKIIFNILFYKSDWEKIQEFDSIANKGVEDKDNIMVLAKAFSIAPNEKVVYLRDSSFVHWNKSPTGCPIIPCIINGKKRYFWFDTGANYSVISSDIAEECDVFPVISEQSKARTGTVKKISIYPAIVDSCRIGDLLIYNSPFVIVHDFDLKLRLFGSHNKTKIDGIIGWKIIQHMDITIDCINSILTIRRPVNKRIPANEKNFFWLGCPFTTLNEENGTPLIFGLDIGSENSSITHKIFDKIAFEQIYHCVKPQTSAGGSVFNYAKLISHLPVVISGHQVEFNNIGTKLQISHLFLNLDGILGSDFMENSTITLDIRNGIFKYQPADYD